MKNTIVLLFIVLIPLGVSIWLLSLIIRALLKYLGTREVRTQQDQVRQSLGVSLRECRTQRQMTQEYVAEALGVSRQAVSKWENGTSDPSTSNLLALARLYGVPAEELLKGLHP